MPAGIWLTKFGQLVADYFGHECYHVGSSLTRKDWRDVDVRLILPDDDFEERFGRGASAETHPKLGAVTLAFAALGQKMTGLPIDFQIQPLTHANDRYPDMRSALIEVREPCPAEAERDNLRMQLDDAREAFREELDLLRAEAAVSRETGGLVD
jgi:hypothetical protein